MNQLRLALCALVASAFSAPPALAQVTADQTVLAETVVVGSDGAQMIETAPAERVTPGDRIAYVLTYRNEGADEAQDVVLVMPVPTGVVMLPGSPTSSDGSPESYSVDGGDTYASLDALTVTQDGQPVPASARDVTHVRWTLARPVAPGAAGQVRYSAILQ